MELFFEGEGGRVAKVRLWSMRDGQDLPTAEYPSHGPGDSPMRNHPVGPVGCVWTTGSSRSRQSPAS